MARIAMVVKEHKRRALVEKHAKQRAELKKKIINPELADDDRAQAGRELQALPRNSNSTRLRNRCMRTGRSRGYLRKFGLCRNAFRDLALAGYIPGITKASW
ncbi:MAG: 30S ribosomal protein S14 [Acidobacteria bacterium]|jgi:small subunit ribosomal protein S14|nr:30S ribosomal protein S14 [Acidobacteriota bacterium]